MIESTEQTAGAMARSFLRLHPSGAARILETLPAAEIARILEREEIRLAAALFEGVLPEVGAEVLQQLRPERAGDILSSLDPARAAFVLSRLDAEAQQRFLALVDRGLAKELRTLMSYPPATAGSLMDPRVLAVRPHFTVEQALGYVRAVGRKRVHDLYVVDDEGRLSAAVALQDLALAAPDDRLEEFVRLAPASVDAMATREEVVDLMTQQRLPSLPVVDAEGRLIGVIRYDRMFSAAQEEASADIQTMVGASKEERALSSVSFAIRKRLPWLEINLLTAFLAAAVVGIFEGLIAKFTALAVLLPIVAGQSGNTGAQALAVTMRGLALREIRPRHWLKVAFKEANVAFINGIAVAITTSLAVYLWSQSVGLAMVIGFSMVVSMVAAGLSGAAIPMILLSLGQDPAQSSSIILTTVTDVVGFFSFLGLATLLAGMLPT